MPGHDANQTGCVENTILNRKNITWKNMKDVPYTKQTFHLQTTLKFNELFSINSINTADTYFTNSLKLSYNFAEDDRNMWVYLSRIWCGTCTIHDLWCSKI